MFKGLIFDFDGTLADTMPIALEAFRKALLPVHGRLLEDAEIRSSFGPSEPGTMPILAPGAEEATLNEFYRHYEELHAKLEAPFDGIRELLDYLRSKNVRLGIVTGKGERTLTFSLAQVGLLNCFDSIECGCERGPCKPLGIRKILEDWGLRPEEALYIGDAPSDVPAAREAGIPIAAVAWADPGSVERLREKRPDWLFTTVAEFREWIADVLEGKAAVPPRNEPAK